MTTRQHQPAPFTAGALLSLHFIATFLFSAVVTLLFLEIGTVGLQGPCKYKYSTSCELVITFPQYMAIGLILPAITIGLWVRRLNERLFIGFELNRLIPLTALLASFGSLWLNQPADTSGGGVNVLFPISFLALSLIISIELILGFHDNMIRIKEYFTGSVNRTLFFSPSDAERMRAGDRDPEFTGDMNAKRARMRRIYKLASYAYPLVIIMGLGGGLGLHELIRHILNIAA